MTEPLKISTSKYTKTGKVDIDGNIWNITVPGAGTELRFSQASRACKLYQARLDLLDKKIADKTITNEELDSYEDYAKKYEDNEKIIFDIFSAVFTDDKDNSSVHKWIDETPTTIIMRAFEDARGQSDGQEPA
jgi:hypothetical protein